MIVLDRGASVLRNFEKRKDELSVKLERIIAKKEASLVYFPAVTSESWSTSGAERLTTLPSRRM
jgi:hypothetical protein